MYFQHFFLKDTNNTGTVKVVEKCYIVIIAHYIRGKAYYVVLLAFIGSGNVETRKITTTIHGNMALFEVDKDCVQIPTINR